MEDKTHLKTSENQEDAAILKTSRVFLFLGLDMRINFGF